MSTEQMSRTIHNLNEQVAQLRDYIAHLTSERDEAQKERDEARACFQGACEELEELDGDLKEMDAEEGKTADVWRSQIEAKVRKEWPKRLSEWQQPIVKRPHRYKLAKP